MRTLYYFLGVKVISSSTGSLHLCQRKNILGLLERYHMDKAKGIHTSMVSSSPLFKHVRTPLDDPREYRSIVGTLKYVVLTRPNIAYAINRIC